MGTMNLEDFRADVLHRTQQTLESLGSNAVNGQTRLDRLINQTLLHIGRPAIYRHREMEQIYTIALVASQETYSLTPVSGVTTPTTAVESVRIVHLTNREDTKRLDKVRFDDTFDQRVAVGRPIEYATFSTGTAELRLQPAPSTQVANDYQLEVARYREPILLSFNSQTTEYTNDWDEVMVQGAVWRVFRQTNNQERAEVAKVEFAQLIAEVTDRVNYEARDKDHGPNVVLPRHMV